MLNHACCCRNVVSSSDAKIDALYFKATRPTVMEKFSRHFSNIYWKNTGRAGARKTAQKYVTMKYTIFAQNRNTMREVHDKYASLKTSLILNIQFRWNTFQVTMIFERDSQLTVSMRSPNWYGPSDSSSVDMLVNVIKVKQLNHFYNAKSWLWGNCMPGLVILSQVKPIVEAVWLNIWISFLKTYKCFEAFQEAVWRPLNFRD